MSIEQKLNEVGSRIEVAAQQASRNPDNIRLVAVSKGRTAADIITAYQAGQTIFGENRVEEGADKIRELEDFPDIEWHMIGHIQSRKANAVVDKFDYIHSVDREKIANKISRSISNPDFPLGVLLECNVSGEATKGGWRFDIEEQWPERVKLLSPLFSLPGARIDGLMTMAPYNASDDQLHTVFGRLRRLRDQMQEALSVGLPELSMGMTDDFEIAIQEGATLVRVGRAIFGER